jgi:Ca-activated chloride channel family protein
MRLRIQPALLALALAVAVTWVASGCSRGAAPLVVSAGQTFAELRAVKGDVTVLASGEAPRVPYPRERLAEGTTVTLADGGLAWLRRDTGAVLLVDGPARLVARDAAIEVTRGRAFVDTSGGPPARLETPRGPIELSDARASVEVATDGTASAYVLRGSARAGGADRAGAGELLVLRPQGAPTHAPAVAWDDWTGGLATADSEAEPAPFGVGTVGARPAGDRGKPRFSLVVQRLEVRVTIDRDFAQTEVDETFVNPTSSVVEGIFSFRTPPGAVLQRFGVDRNGDLVWGRVKESAAAVAQYESNVYAGSTEDPALLTWAAPGTYAARLYPINPGAQRRVVTRYTEWLPREGPRGDRRLYVYPMAAEGARASLPRIEELTVTLDLARAGALRVRSGMGGVRDGQRVAIKAFDLVPLADLAVELFDDGQSTPVAYRAPHALGAGDAPVSATTGQTQGDTTFAAKVSSEEPDYLLVPVRTTAAETVPPGMDLAVVVDTSAATESGALSVARSLTSALLAHLGPADRAALWAGDAVLHPVADGSGALTTLDDARRRAWLDGLATVDRGGATDIGALLTEAASKLDPKRRGAVVYVGDGQPSVGEIAPKTLRERLSRLPPGTRVFTCALGSNANTALLASVARGAPVEIVSDAYGAARTALRLLEAAQRPTWVGATVDLGPGVERILPRELPAVGADEGVLVVGRVTGKPPTELTLRGSGQSMTASLRIEGIDDAGDLRRRWGEQRVAELVAEGAGRAAVVDVGRRYAIVSPFTALYVPTTREMTEESLDPDLADTRRDRISRWKPWWGGSKSFALVGAAAEPAPVAADDKEGGNGTRAKGEEGSMGNPNARDNTQTAMKEAAQFGMLGMIAGERTDPNAPVAPWGAEAPPQATASPPPAPRAPMRAAPKVRAQTATAAASATAAWGDTIVDGFGANGVPLSDTGVGGGGRGQGIGLSSLGTAGHGAGAGPGRAGKDAKGEKAKAGLVTDIAGAADQTTPAEQKPLAERKAPLASVDHSPRPCSPGADLAFDERRVLWGERLSGTHTARDALGVYRRALADCEAPTWRERNTLLLMTVGALPSVRERVALWRSLLGNAAEADVVYRAIVVRVQTTSDLKELHDALGLRGLDPDLLAGMLKRAKTPADRLSTLRAAALKWPDDLELSLRVLDAYDDVGDDGGGRAWARRLRHRPDATAHVYTDVGEYYLRLSHRESAPLADRDAEDARRTFGELVEFAPEDPVARRRLGDLLRAHGWYEEAFRQYETLAQLTPDDPTVPLLLASAAQGMGRIEEAVSWAEKAASTGAPDGSSPLARAARATASAFIAWAQDDAARAGRKDDAEKLLARGKRVAGADAAPVGSVRFLVTWAHPELHPVLWTNALGAPMPAQDNFPLYGLAEAVLPAGSPQIELRLDPEDAARAARLGAHAVVTALVGEGTPAERVVHIEVGFGDPQHGAVADVKVRLADDGLHVEGT